MKSRQIRKIFLNFFKSKGHQIVPSAPIVIKNDPTLLFTNAGMNQFKDYFLGNKVPEFTRIADTQKCLRVSGKHNDLEEVGIDTYHHTMFEMLGNWSFGDYFKKDAIAWAWELLTKEYRLEEDRIYVTVFGGDKPENLEPDHEARQLWSEILPDEKILFGNKKDNFWEMGDTGPCGPCSEIHIDLREGKERKAIPGKDLVNQGHPLVIEIWNLVFIQYNRLADGSLKALPQKHVDTGMGFERLAMAIQNKQSNYDTDIFTPLLNAVSGLSGVKYGESTSTDVAMRVVADHIRAICFSVADGQLPSNTGAGYVIRRILRRAVRYGYTFLNLREPFLFTLVKVMVVEMGDFFPELEAQQDYLEKVIKEEEASFLNTLETGLKRLDVIISGSKGKVISGEQAFELYDTFGFPLDLTILIAREKGFEVDEKGFQSEMAKQKERSKADAKKETGDWTIIHSGEAAGFVGYDQTESDVRILRYRNVKIKGKDNVQIVLDRTPFYAESGGQIGDTGWLIHEKEKVRITDTQKENDLIIHFAENLPEDLRAQFQARVDVERRTKIMNNHSATHLLHAALREVLGKHVQQKGSLVSDTILRFDFSHFAKMTEEEIEKVEDLVNEKIRQNIKREVRLNVPIDKAKELGAMALFGEKYGDFVRVVTFDPEYSIELCGGTHVPYTGSIGLIKIISEGSIAAGVRRVEAVTGSGAMHYFKDQEKLIQQIKDVLKDPKDVVKAVTSLLEDKNALTKKLEELSRKQQGEIKDQLKKEIRKGKRAQLLVEEIDISSPDQLKNLAFDLLKEVNDLFLILAAKVEDKPQIIVGISDSLVQEKSLDAASIVRELAKEINGGGGGQKFLATAGGKNAEGLSRVVEKGKALINSLDL